MRGPQFKPDQDIPDLSGKVILVTGANSGIGRETIFQLAKHNPARIFLGARSETKAQEAITGLQKDLPASSPPISFLPLDLSSFQSIKSAVQTFHASSNRLDILINNAGIMATPPGQTEEGYEIQFGTNHMGHALLTRLLLPTLKHTASIASDVRVVFLSSNLESNAPKEGYFLDSRLKTPMTDISTWTRYGQSKLANIHYPRALAERNREIKFVSLHPGVVKTNLGTDLISGSNFLLSTVFKIAMKLVTVDVGEGALFLRSLGPFISLSELVERSRNLPMIRSFANNSGNIQKRSYNPICDIPARGIRLLVLLSCRLNLACTENINMSASTNKNVFPPTYVPFRSSVCTPVT